MTAATPVHELVNQLGLRRVERQAVTARLDASTLAVLDQLAMQAGVSRSKAAAALLHASLAPIGQ